MTKKYLFLKTAFICSVFSTPLLASEDQQDFVTPFLIGQSKTLEAAVPQRSMVSELGSQFKEDITHKTKNKVSHAFDLGKKILQDRDLGPLVVDLLEEYLTAANQKLIGEFFKPKHSLAKDDFDVEALRPLVEFIRNKLCDLIGEFVLKRNLIGYLPDGKIIKIYENRTLFNLLLDAFIPDLVPAKRLIIKVADIGPIRNYLVNKFDEMIIKGILSLYQKTTGKVVKQSVSDLVSSLTATSTPELDKGKDHKEAEKMATSQPSVADKIAKEEIEVDGSHVWEFLEPRLNHYLRIALCDILKPGVETFVNDLGHYGQRKILPSTSTLNQYAVSGVLGYTTLGIMGVPLFLAGNYAKNTACESFLKVLRHRMTDYLDLYVKYYSYDLIEYTPDEHYLYSLNSNPSTSERAILAKDYETQEKIREKGFIGAIIKDLAKRTWIGQLISSPEEIDDIRNATRQSAEMKNSLSTQITLGEIAAKKKSGGKLSSEQEQLLKNLLDFPSYEIRKKEIELINLWGKGDKSIAHQAENLRRDLSQVEAKLIDVYNLYGKKIPREFAWVYQQLEFWDSENSDKFIVDFIDVEKSIAKLILENIGHFSRIDLDLFKAAVEDEKFLRGYVQNFVAKHDLSQKTDISDAEGQAVLQDQKLLKGLPAAYAHYKYQNYIQENQKTITLLQKSPLCFGFSEVEVIDLHMHMTPQQLEQHTTFEMPYEEVLQAIARDLANDVNHPTIAAVEAELETVKATMKRVVQDDLHKIIEHYSATFVKNADIPAFIKGIKFPLDLKEQASRIDLQASGYKNIKDYYPRVEDETLKLIIAQAEFIKKEFLDQSEKWPIFKKFRDELKQFVKDGKLRSSIYQKIYNDILDQLVMNHTKDEITEFVLLESEVARAPKEKIEISPYSSLSIYDKSDFAGFYVSNLVNKLVKEGKIKDVSHLSREELIHIHQEIQKFKEDRTIEAESCLFMKDHLSYLIKFKSTLLEYNQKLFYGYREIVEQIMAANYKTLVEIKRQPKKES